MSKYLIKIDNNVKEINDISLDNGYEIDIKSKRYPMINKVIIYDNDLKDNFITNKIMKDYHNILKLIEDDDGSGDTVILDDIVRLKEIIEYQYKKYLKKENYQNFINALFSLENMYNINKEEIMEVKR